MSFLDTQKEYWNTLALKVKDDIACTHYINQDSSPVNIILYREIALYLKNKFLNCKQNGDTLEIGCGNGLIIAELKKIVGNNFNLFGTDISDEMISRAIIDDAKYYCCDARKIPLEDKRFDLIYLHSVVQYFDNENYFVEVIKECIRLLKTGGSICFLDTPLLWYKDLMVSKANNSWFSEIKNVIKRKIPLVERYLTRKREKSGSSWVEKIDGVEMTLPSFSGYWVDPHILSNFENKFRYVTIEHQLFESKPIEYKKFRSNIIFRELLYN